MPIHFDQLSAVFCTDEQNPNVTDRFFQFRKSLFIDALRWDLNELEGREKDQFDTASAVYCILHRKGRVIAGFRAIRTDRPYLAQTVFPQLATLAPYPQRRDVWEVSRFGVAPAEAGSPTARILYSLMFRFAQLCHANCPRRACRPALRALPDTARHPHATLRTSSERGPGRGRPASHARCGRHSYRQPARVAL